MSEDTDFPWEYVYEHRESEVIRMERLHVWLKRCIEDYPGTWKPTAYDGYPSTIPIARHKIQEWFDTWFSQFKLKGEEK